jgi:hypothetical protein
MAPRMADHVRQNLAGIQSFVASFGEMKALTFRKVSDDGGDEFDGDFEKGTMLITVQLDEEGRIADLNFIPR